MKHRGTTSKYEANERVHRPKNEGDGRVSCVILRGGLREMDQAEE